MTARLGAFSRKIKHFFDRSEWVIRLLRFSRSENAPGTPGLVMIQIDGLSFKQFNRALKERNLPFLRFLRRRKRYVVHSHYSGLPSNTPAVQGELFYGVKTGVPAFCFLDRASGKVFKMYDGPAAETIEARLQKQGEGLLAGGSSYCNIFRGGAAESHFCAAEVGWRSFLRTVNPLILQFLILCYVDIFIRTLFLMVVEFFLALFDCVRGTIQGKFFRKEFEFISARVMVCVLLRELIVAGVLVDMARGLPVICANFVGYDEQAHRRGPSSAFAHWSLQGIDDAIRRIWQAAERCQQRDYDVWIYSDHGQEKTISYPAQHGRTLDEAVKQIFNEEISGQSFVLKSQLMGTAAWRAGFLDKKFFQKWTQTSEDEKEKETTPSAIVTAMGPIGHVYLSKKLSRGDVESFAGRLVAQAGIPLVLVSADGKEARAWTQEGRFILPQEAAKVLGERHPFLDEAAEDLMRICRHENAGDFVLTGWSVGNAPLTFPIENGAHAGMGPEETSGFAFLPENAPLKASGKGYLRPCDLREAALLFLRRYV